MSNSDELRRGMAGYQSNRSRLLYEETGNPVHVWQAYRAARKAGVEIPDWVLAYFDNSADALERNPGKGSEILEALGFATGGRRESRASAQLEWARTVDILRHKFPHWTKDKAIKEVAEQKSVSENSVKEAYNRFF